MQRTFPSIPFERYADDAIVHCRSEKQARFVLDVIRARHPQLADGVHQEQPAPLG
jgi:hypothetical protein